MKSKKGRESVMPSKFSERLIAARKKMGITQKELAERIDIAPSSLSAYEHKGKYPTLDVAVRLAYALDVSLDWLAGRNDRNKICNISDVFRELVLIAKSGAACSLYSDKNTAYFGIKSGVLSSVFKDWSDISRLYNAGTINGELYDLWLDKQLSDMEELFCDDVGFPNNDSDSENIEDDELPF